jgi:hypothetical protein
VFDLGLFNPTVAFIRFQIELADGFDGVTRHANFCVVRGEFVNEVHSSREGAVALLVESRAYRLDRGGEQGLIFDIEFVDAESGFYGRELG